MPEYETREIFGKDAGPLGNDSRNVPEMTAGCAALVGLVDRYLRGLLDSFVTLLEVHKLLYIHAGRGGTPEAEIRRRSVWAVCRKPAARPERDGGAPDFRLRRRRRRAGPNLRQSGEQHLRLEREETTVFPPPTRDRGRRPFPEAVDSGPLTNTPGKGRMKYVHVWA